MYKSIHSLDDYREALEDRISLCAAKYADEFDLEYKEESLAYQYIIELIDECNTFEDAHAAVKHHLDEYNNTDEDWETSSDGHLRAFGRAEEELRTH